MAQPVWMDQELLVRLHEEILRVTGGATGIRDIGLLNSALARPVNRYVYDSLGDLVELAATYAVGIASNHPFVDGNKRTAFMALGLFLDDNGLQLIASQEDATEAMLSVAAGKMDILALTDWLRRRVA